MPAVVFPCGLSLSAKALLSWFVASLLSPSGCLSSADFSSTSVSFSSSFSARSQLHHILLLSSDSLAEFISFLCLTPRVFSYCFVAPVGIVGFGIAFLALQIRNFSFTCINEYGFLLQKTFQATSRLDDFVAPKQTKSPRKFLEYHVKLTPRNRYPFR